MLIGLVAGSLLLAAPVPAHPPARVEGPICVTVAHLWWGDNKDIRAISTHPVPESFARVYRQGGCAAWSLVKERLIEWNLAFGDERTTTAAIRFFEERLTAHAEPPERLSQAIGAARRRAEPAIAAAAPLLEKNGDVRERAEDALFADRYAAELRTLNGVRDGYFFLAQQYARAAGFYASRSLYEKAQRYFAAVGATIHAEPSGTRNGRDMAESYLGITSYRAAALPDLDMTIAVLRARLTRSTNDIAAARDAIERHADAAIRAYGERAESDPGDPCEGEGRSDRALAEACNDPQFLRRRAEAWWRNDAQLELLALGDLPRDGSDAASQTLISSSPFWEALEAVHKAVLLARDPNNDDPFVSRPMTPDVNDKQIALLLARADLYRRIGEARAAQPFESGMVANEYTQALADLALAAKLAGPAQHPGRFRQAAERYLDLYSHLAGDPRARIALDQEPARQAAYFHLVLPLLSRIAGGDALPAAPSN